MSLGIRWRLSLWNTLALAIMLLGLAGLIYALLRHALYEQTDRSLRAALTQASDGQQFTAGGEGLSHWLGELWEHQHLLGVVHDGHGTALGRSQEMPVTSIPPAPAVATGAVRLRDQVVPTLGQRRALEAGLLLEGRPVTLTLLAPLDEVNSELARLRAALLIAVPAMLVLSGGLAYALARQALNPVEQLRRSTEAITAAHLDRRLSVPNAHDELGRLAQTVNAMIARLERSFAEMRRFTADASHELRTPLTAIRAEAEVALGRPLSSADCQQLLGSVLEECDRLAHLTDQLLTLARQDAAVGAQPRVPVDLTALVKDVTDTMRPLAESKGLRLHFQESTAIEVPADAPRLRQVFFNILDNAIKYSQKGRVQVACVRRDKSAVVTVCDTGVGIATEHLTRVFDRFYRVDKSRSRQQGGTGLGLSIARSIVSGHGGTIELTSMPGGGTTCTITLPSTAAG